MTAAPQSCGSRCVKEYGEALAGDGVSGRVHGEIAHVRLIETKTGDSLVAWRGFQVVARLCGHHQAEASHDLTDPKRDARRFVVGALVGRKTVATLCEQRKGAT